MENKNTTSRGTPLSHSLGIQPNIRESTEHTAHGTKAQSTSKIDGQKKSFGFWKALKRKKKTLLIRVFYLQRVFFLPIRPPLKLTECCNPRFFDRSFSIQPIAGSHGKRLSTHNFIVIHQRFCGAVPSNKSSTRIWVLESAHKGGTKTEVKETSSCLQRSLSRPRHFNWKKESGCLSRRRSGLARRQIATTLCRWKQRTIGR